MEAFTKPAYRTISEHGIAEVRQRMADQQHALFARRSFVTGEQITVFSAGTISPEPTWLTIQVGARKHITLQPDFLQYTNHSCDPNVFFDTGTMQLVALKDIVPGEELTFFYPSTEWRMSQPFHCYCGSPACLGTIRGAQFLSREQQSKYRLTSFIRQELAKQKRTTKKVA